MKSRAGLGGLLWVACVIGSLYAGPGLADPPQASPPPPSSDTPPPPPPSGNLSDKLSKSQGTIQPPHGTDPGMPVRPPPETHDPMTVPPPSATPQPENGPPPQPK
jgi:hypothetical protein